MNRRVSIRNMIIFAGGVTFLPACLGPEGKASVALSNINISAQQEKLLSTIAATLIPKTDTPGADETGAHLFVLKMVDDCYEKADQDKFVLGLDQLEKAAQKRFGKSMLKCTAADRQKLLQGVEDKDGFAPEVYDFYKIMKQRTIQGYMTSQFVLQEIEHYTIIPTVKYDGYHRIGN
ncbi:gluconate 2-dehydrogenase subunit 3 family protein [Adhaeribacter radiodurans]|uniref:Gluconate 2-dehydrogenase subunit 3 family protein n=1 Tax=Adhaeribacter radiodurans TaxID=2745197 RepID=A0A7L7L3N7_9BACT|nr:gluconate 2-dehydrogenase subunit 3 family protein [Adhaeribacter radiodurans]QMU27390.1 gluconate 2-dehydrogenase subunit 3 family protein [Adhaeribacter radiodurans]